jgi:hypothetical protein
MVKCIGQMETIIKVCGKVEFRTDKVNLFLNLG